MNSQQLSVEKSTAGVGQQAARGRALGRYIPLAWTVVVAAVVAWIQTTELTRDYKTVAIIAGALLLLVGYSAWFACASPFSRRTRWTSVLLFWGAAYVLYVSVDIVNDGDGRWVGWRFIWQAKPDQLLEIPEVSQDALDWQTSPQDYPRFLGNGNWAEVKNVRLATDWSATGPEEIWRRDLGAGWSSFAIVGDYAFTQEQRGPQEMVVCYRVSTGGMVWTHSDEARFDPVTAGGGMGGVGPRATPTVHGDYVITQGATGIVNCLAAQTGQVIWSRDTIAEHGADNLLWGKSGSPLVVDGMVVVNVGAPAKASQRKSYNASLVAYDLQTGEVRWAQGNRVTAYPSPVLTTFAGQRQVLQINENYLTAHRVADGRILWEHQWLGSSSGNASCAQPVPLAGDRVFLSRGYGDGASLIQVLRADGVGFTTKALWQPEIKQVMKTKFGNVVMRDGYVYGLDGIILQCIELKTGRSMWKKRRQRPFGHGQILLIGDVILILSETGELGLVDCTPDRYHELAAMQVLSAEDVTWNNPAFAAPFLLVRNAREAACFRLPLASEGS